MKLLLYILAMLPVYPTLVGVSISFDPYDTAVYETGRWMMIWFILLLSLGPLMRSFRIRQGTWGKQPLGLAVFSWALLHVLSYFVFHSSTIGRAALELVTKPFLVIGVIAFTFLILLAATSYQRAIRWLGKKWNVLHKLSLWAAALGATHGLVAQKVAINEFGAYSLIILILLMWRGLTAIRKV